MNSFMVMHAVQVLPQKCLEVFTPSELVLLISGVPHIDVADWEKNTRVSKQSSPHDISLVV